MENKRGLLKGNPYRTSSWSRVIVAISAGECKRQGQRIVGKGVKRSAEAPWLRVQPVIARLASPLGDQPCAPDCRYALNNRLTYLLLTLSIYAASLWFNLFSSIRWLTSNRVSSFWLMISMSLTLSFPFDGLYLCVYPIEYGHFNFPQRGLYYFGQAI